MALKGTLEESVREDGLRVITKKLPSAKRVQVEVIAGVGSAYDPPDKIGLFHFFEHMAFKGTVRRTVDDLNALDGRYFLMSNAYTGRLVTNYFGSAIYRRLPEINDVLFDMYLNSIFPEEEIEREKNVVLLEVARDNDDDEHAAHCALWKLLWKKNPLRNFGVGTEEGMRAINRELLIATKEKYYTAANTTILGLGRVDHVSLRDKAFKEFPLSAVKIQKKTWDHESDDLPDCVFTNTIRPGREKAMIVLGAKIPALSEREWAAMFVLIEMLARGKDSMLWNEIREKRGLAYTVSGAVSGSYSLGHFVYADGEMKPDKVSEVRELIPEVMSELPLNEDHFSRVRDAMVDRTVLMLESIQDWSRSIMMHVIDGGKELSYLNGYDRKTQSLLRRITFEEVKALRERLMKPERFVCSVVKPN